MNRNIIYLFLFLLLSCGKHARLSEDLKLNGLPIKMGKTSLKDIRAAFAVEPCDSGSGDYIESMDCYSIKLICWNSKIDYLFIVFRFNHDTQKLVGILLNSKLKKGCNLSTEEMKIILTDSYGLSTSNESYLITNGRFEQATFDERFWVHKMEYEDTYFYYEAQLNDAGYTKFNLEKVEID